MTATPAAPASPLRLAGRLLVSALLLVPLGGLLGAAALALAAWAWGPVLGDAPVAGAWSLAALYAVCGLAGGAVLGATLAVARGLAGLEDDLAMRVARQPNPEPSAGPRWPVAELRHRYDQVLDQIIAQTIGRLPLPALAGRLVRAQLRQALVEDFLADSERSGVATVGPDEVRRWLLAKGPGYLLVPARVQVRLWQAVVTGVLVALAAAPWVLRALRG